MKQDVAQCLSLFLVAGSLMLSASLYAATFDLNAGSSSWAFSWPTI